MPIIQKFNYYDFSKLSFNKMDFSSELLNGFVLKLQLKNPIDFTGRKTIFSCPYFSIDYAKLNIKTDEDKLVGTELSDRVFMHADNDGFISLLEIKSTFNSVYFSEPKEMIIDLPLSLFDAKNKDIYFVYDRVHFGFIVDGEMVNLNYPFGDLINTYFDNVKTDYIDVLISNELNLIDVSVKEELLDKSINFYSPRGYNAWAGDVVNFYHNGTYHLLYLLDRHHHGSRWGSGAHTMCQLTTKDFINWEEQGSLAPLDAQWKTLGTGTMFFYNNKYYFSHGWHTSRNIPNELLGSSVLREKFEKSGEIIGLSYDELKNKGLYPNGATYEISDDGINFYPSNMQIHVAENPTIFVENNKLKLVAGYGFKGVWEADNLNGPWKMIFDNVANKSNMNPTDECPSIFSKNGFTYLIMGGTGYWMTEKNKNEFIDQAIKGIDIYDGLVYPMVSKTDDERLILGGWINGYGWGSIASHRELIQEENGILSMRWLPELSPNKNILTKIFSNNNSVSICPNKSYYLEFNVNSNENSNVFIRFVGDTDAVLWLNSNEKIIQISKVEKNKIKPNEIKPVYVTANEYNGQDFRAIKDVPKNSVDFALSNAYVLDCNYKIKLQIYYEPKFKSVIIDAEIGGKCTIVSNRINQTFSSVRIDSLDATISNLEVYEM